MIVQTKLLGALVIASTLVWGCGGGGGGVAIQSGDSSPPPPPPAEPAKAEANDVGSAHLKGDHLEVDKQILFDTDSDHINEEQSKGILSDLVGILKAHPEVVHLQIVGHTDVNGTAAHNQDLSERRAAAVAKYINGHGLPNVKIDTVGYGKTKPLCAEDTEACHDKNRRVEFNILK
jgi:outer membrane protein OmpA-like peptidoglycan-associated protein